MFDEPGAPVHESVHSDPAPNSGASSSSACAPGPPPCAETQGDGGTHDEPQHKAYGKADVVTRMPPFGKISFYSRYSRFEAVCAQSHSGHISCRLTRGCLPSKDPANTAMGRPLGLMVAWLFNELNFTCRSEHVNVFALSTFDHAQRLKARAYLRAVPGGAALLDCERARRSDEPDEPIELP